MPWRAQAVRTNTGQSSDLSDDYKLRAALEGTHFCLAKTDIPLNVGLFWGFITTRQTANSLCPFKLYQNSVQGGMVDAKSYFTNAKTHHDQP